MTARRGGLLRGTFRQPSAIASVIWLAILIIGLAILVPLVSPYGPNDQDLSATLQMPSAAHWWGTDALGRDILTRIAVGSHVTLSGVLIVAVVANVLGIVMGMLAGHFRAGWDATFTATADMLQSIPALVILLSVAAVTARNVTVVMLVLGVLMSTGAYRIYRASTLNIRGELFITAARTSGLREGQIIARHELPRLLGQLFISTSIVASLAIVIQIGLGFLGIDTSPPDPSWGNIINDTRSTIYTSIWPLVPPAVVVALTVLSLSAIGDAAQKAIAGNPRQSGLGRRSRRAHPKRTTDAAALAPVAASLPQAVLVLEDLSIAVEKAGVSVTLVSNLSLTIMPGEVVGLVGESGAGKSVTARAALGILPAEATATGSVRVDGCEMLGTSEKALQRVRGSKISYIAQEPMAALNPVYRVGNQLIEALRTHHRMTHRQAKRRAIELLETVQIKDPASVMGAYPHQISGGMAQRIVIAIALSGDPDVVVADEPTTALDVSVQMQILDLLRALQRERGLAVLLVTHDWGVVADICDRGVAMYAGEVVEEAAVAELFAQPRHPYSIALRESDPHAQARGEPLQSISGQVPPPGTWPLGCRFADRCAFAVDVCREAPVALETLGDGHKVRCIRAADVETVRHG